MSTKTVNLRIAADFLSFLALFNKNAPGKDDTPAKQHLQNYNDAMGIKNKVDKAGAQARAVRTVAETGGHHSGNLNVDRCREAALS